MMKIKWISAQAQTRAGEMMPGETYEIDNDLGDEFVRRGLAESFRPALAKKIKDEEDAK